MGRLGHRRGAGRYIGRKAGIRLHYQYDKDRDVLTIEGQQYSGEFFRQIAAVSAEPLPLTMKRNEHGVVVFEKMPI